MVNMRWSLDSLYPSFESKEFLEDLKECDRIIEEAKAWSSRELATEDGAPAKIEAYIRMKQKLHEKAITLYNFAELTLSVDARNEDAAKYIEIIRMKMTELTEPEVAFQKWLSQIGSLNKAMENSTIIQEHQFFLKEILEKSRHILSEKEEIIISKLANTGSQSWSKLQEHLTSILMVDITLEGEEKSLPLPVIRNLAYEDDLLTRKAAYEAELKAYKRIEDSSAACLNSIKGEVITLSKLRGYESPLDATLMNSRMSRKTLDAMMEAIGEKLESFRKYYRKKSSAAWTQERPSLLRPLRTHGRRRKEVQLRRGKKLYC